MEVGGKRSRLKMEGSRRKVKVGSWKKKGKGERVDRKR